MKTRLAPFSYERYLAGDKVVNGQGYRITEIYKRKAELEQIYGIIVISAEIADCFTLEGKYDVDEDSCLDLFIEEEIPEPKMVTMFMNIYNQNGSYYAHSFQNTEEMANRLKRNNLPNRTIKITFEEF